MNWNNKLKEIKEDKSKTDAMKVTNHIFNEMKNSVISGYDGKVFGFYIGSDVGKILTEQGLGYKTFREENCDIYSHPFEESSVWIIK